MQYTAAQIARFIAPAAVLAAPQQPIEHLLTDSRHLLQARSTLFFALPGPRRSGDDFVEELYEKGVRSFVVSRQPVPSQYADANFFVVPDVLKALQALAAAHRQQFSIPVIGITGSNGKTIVKEWLYQLLQGSFQIVRSPKSYNSQVGVPLSVWQLNEQHTLAIFEAGISQPGEMAQLAAIIQPTIGVFTNLGEAHSAGFASPAWKLAEKSRLFATAEVVITAAENGAFFADKNCFLWGADTGAQLQVLEIRKQKTDTFFRLLAGGREQAVHIPFTDDASVQNALTCCAVLQYLGIDPEQVHDRFRQLHAVDMRLHFFAGINQCTIINDSYSADLTSLAVALNFLNQQSTGQQRTVILSDFVESGKPDADLYHDIAVALQQHRVQRVIGIGSHISARLPQYLPPGFAAEYYPSTSGFLQQFRSSAFGNETILVKGARRFSFEVIAQLFERKVHQTVLQINLSALLHNVKQYQQLLQPGTRLMAMVKAFAYGSGGVEIAAVLQRNNVDYLGVAYADEGIDLRRAGISMPVMVINADASSFAALVEYNLQPVIYSFELLQQFEHFIGAQGLSAFPVHLELETGMNRLGFSGADVAALGARLAASGLLQVQSVFSHLAASEDPQQDAFTRQQAALLQTAVAELRQHLTAPFLMHLSNSAAIIRHPQLQFDMVRLGIGLYGIETVPHTLELLPVATLRSTIAQIKHLNAGETVSYNRKGLIEQPSVIATVRIGYADGYSRHLSNGKGCMWIRGRLAPVVGTVCMDMTMVDITGIPAVQEGDEVIVFGPELPVHQVARWAGTIPYEILTAVSQRVKRVYVQE